MATLLTRPAKPRAVAGDFFTDLDRRFDEFLSRPFGWRWPGESMESSRARAEAFPTGWADLGFAVDIFEKDNDLVCKLQLPGVKREDIDVTVDADAIHLRAERKLDEKTEEAGFYRREIAYGSVERTIPLPRPVNHDKAQAYFENGVLTIRAPKSDAQPSGRKIQIK
jgi:HSP20 family protein